RAIVRAGDQGLAVGSERRGANPVEVARYALEYFSRGHLNQVHPRGVLAVLRGLADGKNPAIGGKRHHTKAFGVSKVFADRIASVSIQQSNILAVRAHYEDAGRREVRHKGKARFLVDHLTGFDVVNIRYPLNLPQQEMLAVRGQTKDA